mgnify:CR=1 FL=1
MSIGTVSALVSILGTFFVTVWRLKKDQTELQKQVETRLARIETDVSWVVSQTKEINKYLMSQYLEEVTKYDNERDK